MTKFYKEDGGKCRSGVLKVRRISLSCAIPTSSTLRQMRNCYWVFVGVFMSTLHILVVAKQRNIIFSNQINQKF